MKEVTPEDVMPEDDVKLELKSQGLTLAKYVKLLKSELSAMEIKTQIPTGETAFVYSKRLKAWKIRQDARRDLGQHYGVESVAESKANLTIEVVQFKKEDCKESNADT